jgi:hypothetical protein
VQSSATLGYTDDVPASHDVLSGQAYWQAHEQEVERLRAQPKGSGRRLLPHPWRQGEQAIRTCAHRQHARRPFVVHRGIPAARPQGDVHVVARARSFSFHSASRVSATRLRFARARRREIVSGRLPPGGVRPRDGSPSPVRRRRGSPARRSARPRRHRSGLRRSTGSSVRRGRRSQTYHDSSRPRLVRYRTRKWRPQRPQTARPCRSADPSRGGDCRATTYPRPLRSSRRRCPWY